MKHCEEAGRRHLHDLAASSSSRKMATGALLDKSMSDNNFSIQSSKEDLRCNESNHSEKNNNLLMRLMTLA